MGQRGGVLSKLVFAVFFMAAGAAGILYWQNRTRLDREVREAAEASRRAAEKVAALAEKAAGQVEDKVAEKRPPKPSSIAKAPVQKDATDLCAWVQAKNRELLAERGVQDAHVLKSFNAERRRDGAVWIEHTLEVKSPAGFNKAAYLSAFTAALRSKGLILIKNEKAADAWTLEGGAGGRVYERVIFLNAARAASSLSGLIPGSGAADGFHQEATA